MKKESAEDTINIKGKKAQFYLIAAVIIVMVILSLAAVSNYVNVKKTPQKFYDLADILNSEGKYVVLNAAYTDKNVNTNIENYLYLFSKYLEDNTDEDFNIIIFYGDSKSNNVTGKVYSRSSIGNVNIYLGDSPFTVQGGETVSINSTSVQVKDAGEGKKEVEVVIYSKGLNITQTLPILADNNFVFVMTTSQEFNQYVQNSINQTAPI